MDFSQLLRHLLFSELLNGLPPWKAPHPLKYIDLERTKKPMEKIQKNCFQNPQKTHYRTIKKTRFFWCLLYKTGPRTFNSSVTPTQRLDWPNQSNGIGCGSLGIPRLFSQQVGNGNWYKKNEEMWDSGRYGWEFCRIHTPMYLIDKMHGERYIIPRSNNVECILWLKRYDMFGNVCGGVARSNPIIYRNGHYAYQCISYIPKCCDKTSLCIRCVMSWLGLVAGLLGGF